MNKTKYTCRVNDYIFQNNIWVKTDRFDTKVKSSPGHIIMLHPKLVNRDGFMEELLVILTQAKSKIDLDKPRSEDEDQKGIKDNIYIMIEAWFHIFIWKQA